MPRRSRRSRFSRRRRGRGMRRFARAIARAGSEPKHFESAAFIQTLNQGDTVAPLVHIRNVTSNLVQGDTEANFTGNQVFLKGLSVRVGASTFDDTLSNFSTVMVRYTLLFSRTNATGMTGAGATYGGTTTDNTNPAQATPFANPRLFDINATPGRFTSSGYETFWDTTNIKVKASKLIKINIGGAGNGLQLKKIYFRINKTFQFNNPDNSPLTATPNHGRFGSWYLVVQVFTPPGIADPTDGTSFGTITDNMRLYFRDP